MKDILMDRKTERDIDTSIERGIERMIHSCS